MKKIGALLTLCLCSFLSFSQNYNVEKINKKAKALLNDANKKVESDKFEQAINLLQQALKIDAGYIDAYLLLAAIYSNSKKYIDCTNTYEKAFAIDSIYTIEYRLPYSIALAGDGRFENALQATKSLLALQRINPNTRRAAEFRKKTYEFAVDYAAKNANKPYVFAPQNMGDSINSKMSEYFPSLTIDNSQLIFTRNIDYRNEDFYHSQSVGNKWHASKPMSKSINTPLNEGAQTISQDGKWLVFTGCDRRDGYGSCDIYISFLRDTGWSEPLNLGRTINSEFWESQPCLSSDKKDLYFASRNPVGMGGSDLYVSHLQDDGYWSKPENLGPSINTPGDEQCPFIHADNQTLYFTSNGLPGYGDADLFYCRKGPRSTWSKPTNLGYPINSIHKEGTLFIAADGKTAYYASDRADSKGDLDIYSFELRADVRPYKTLWVKGRVTDNKTKKGLPSVVELVNLADNSLVFKVNTDQNGNYFITLPLGKDYAFNVSKKGYLFYSDNFLLGNRAPDSTFEKNIQLFPIENNASVVLKNIFFDVNKFELKTESQNELNKLVQLMIENPSLKIEISGHTDNVGKPTDNLILSKNRATAVVTYLITKGIATQRLSAKGFAETRPLADNKTEDGRAANRRTEMKVVAQ